MKAFVTGATGFVGSHVAEALLARGDAVTCLARQPERAAALATRGAALVQGSLEDDAALASAVTGAEVVYHIAGLIAGSEAEYFAVNQAGTRRLVAAVRRTAPGARFVYVSSQAAVGPGRRLAEDAPCGPVSPYGRSKLAGEEAVRGAADLTWVIVRPPSVYGPRDRAFLPLFRLARRGLAPVFGSGAQELSLVYVADLADAITRAGTRAEAAGRTYHLAHPDVVTSRELVGILGRAVGTRPLVIPVPLLAMQVLVAGLGVIRAALGRRNVVNLGRLAEYFAPAWTFNVTRAERELGWRAAHDLGSGLSETAAWYREQGLLH